MQALIDLLLQYLPTASKWIGVLQYVPAATDTVKELIDFVNRTIATLNSPDVPLTPDQQATLDTFIAEDWKTKEYWKEDAEQVPPVPPAP